MKNINIILPTIQEAWIDTGLGNWLNIIMENNGKININNWFRFNNIVKGDFKPPLVNNLHIINNMEFMFANCSGLTSLDLSNFNTSNVTTMYGMFQNCSGLTSLDVSNWNNSKVTNMNGMFSECSGLTSLDLSSFNTSNVTNMNGMFAYCSKLTSLDLSSFNTNNVINISYMFLGCTSIVTIKCSQATQTKFIENAPDNHLPTAFKDPNYSGWIIV